ncbi:MAG: lipopolysaccharide assembly protein LapA domain-containing protein [Acidimicrobiia bacterium]
MDGTARTAMGDNEKDGQPLPPPDMTAETETEATAPDVVRERVFVGTGLFWGLIVGIVLAVAVVILAAQNTGTIDVSFLGWDFSTPLIVLVLGALLIGVVVDELFGLVYRKRRRRTLRERDELQRLR